MLECPRWTCIALGWAPCVMRRAAHVCLRSWIRTPSASPAALSAVLAVPPALHSPRHHYRPQAAHQSTGPFGPRLHPNPESRRRRQTYPLSVAFFTASTMALRKQRFILG
jgi:hypothetical protein